MIIRKFVVLAAILLSAGAFAGSPAPHTWHTVSTSEGTWDASLQMINEGGSFVSQDGSPLTKFSISPAVSKIYGFIFDNGDDFNVAYTLTLTQQDTGLKTGFSAKACVFVVTASGPAQPDIHVLPYNGAKCDWKVVHGRGEDFSVA